ncbi:MAG: hypothetical protein ACOC8D_03005 [bacterium]
MMRTPWVVWMVAAAMMLASGRALAAEAEKAAAAAAAQPDLAGALAGFRGFLVGELIESREKDATLFVRAVTIIEGSEATNPGLLVGRETPVAFATEENDDGDEQPVPGLVRAVEHIGRMPAVHFGGLGGNAVVITQEPWRGAGGAGRNVQLKAHRMVMRVNGGEVRIGGGPDDDEADDEEPAREPKGPLMTARVRAGDDGTLVMDRVAPGSTPAHTWRGMPEFRFADADDQEDEEGADAEPLELKARGKALKAQVKALHRHLAALKKQAGREGLPEAHRDALRRQQAELAERLARLQDEIAERKAEARARKRQAELRQRHKPPEDDKNTDF